MEIERCVKAWAAAAPDRTRVVEYARTHENRPLHYVVITAPKNMARLEEIQTGMARLGDPRKISDAEAKEIIDTLLPVAWLGYTIHGDETEGSDAALAVLYHLIAADDPTVRKLLEEVIVIIDPLQNPDGRDRFLKMIAESRGTMPSVDDQSLQHTGYAPWGRGNHYFFDLNRDSLFGVHPETRGRFPCRHARSSAGDAQCHDLWPRLRRDTADSSLEEMPAHLSAWGSVFRGDLPWRLQRVTGQG